MKQFLAAIAVLLAGPALGPAWAQPDAPPGVPPSMASRLAADRLSAIQPGTYSSGEKDSFTLHRYPGGKFLLRFSGVSESFVLTVDRGAMGTKLLRYDTGAMALRVSVWGGLTLYTLANPGGVPATRQSDAPPLPVLAVSVPEFRAALGDEAAHLAYVQKVTLKFSADPSVLESDPETRGRAFDALTNAALGIERFLAASPTARQTLIKRINQVKLAEGGKPTISIVGQTLLVSFVPGEGHQGHASSLAIQQELGRLMAATAKDVAAK
ncbi:MAG: DUF4908 domain-containing protein [Pseudomonadota bacterium]